MPATDLICLAALPGVVIGAAFAAFTRKAQRAARAFLLTELLWLMVLVVVTVLPAHGVESTWVNPERHVRMVYDAVKNGRGYLDALKDTAPTMQRELEADSYECVAQWMDSKTKTVNQAMAEACMGVRGWIRVSTAKQMADAYGRAWQSEVDRHDGIDPGILADR